MENSFLLYSIHVNCYHRINFFNAQKIDFTLKIPDFSRLPDLVDTLEVQRRLGTDLSEHRRTTAKLPSPMT